MQQVNLIKKDKVSAILAKIDKGYSENPEEFADVFDYGVDILNRELNEGLSVEQLHNYVLTEKWGERLSDLLLEGDLSQDMVNFVISLNSVDPSKRKTEKFLTNVFLASSLAASGKDESSLPDFSDLTHDDAEAVINAFALKVKDRCSDLGVEIGDLVYETGELLQIVKAFFVAGPTVYKTIDMANLASELYQSHLNEGSLDKNALAAIGCQLGITAVYLD